MGIPLDSAKHGEQVISLYTRYVGGKQTLIVPSACNDSPAFTPSPHEGVNLMKASPLGSLSRLPIAYDEYYGN